MIETPVRSRKDPLKELKMEDIKIEFVDLCVLPADGMGMNIVEFESDIGSPADAGMEMEIDGASDASGSDTVRPRKRAKLDHLSPEEKAQHRKMMNRISAQSARDRQKALMMQQEVTIKGLHGTTDSLKKQNAVLVKTNETLVTENSTLKDENERLSNLVLELEAKLKLTSQNSNMTSMDQQQPITPSIKPEVEDGADKPCCGSASEPAVLHTVPLPKEPSEPLQKLSLILLLWMLYHGIWTHQKSCKSSENSQKESLVENNSCQSSSSLTHLQKQLFHKWLLRPRPQELEQRTPG
jgi:hypothetical protein